MTRNEFRKQLVNQPEYRERQFQARLEQAVSFGAWQEKFTLFEQIKREVEDSTGWKQLKEKERILDGIGEERFKVRATPNQSKQKNGFCGVPYNFNKDLVWAGCEKTIEFNTVDRGARVRF